MKESPEGFKPDDEVSQIAIDFEKAKTGDEDDRKLPDSEKEGDGVRNVIIGVRDRREGDANKRDLMHLLRKRIKDEIDRDVELCVLGDGLTDEQLLWLNDLFIRKEIGRSSIYTEEWLNRALDAAEDRVARGETVRKKKRKVADVRRGRSDDPEKVKQTLAAIRAGRERAKRQLEEDNQAA